MNRRIPISELQIGMYISNEGNDWVPTKRKKRKGYIKTQATIDKIKSLGVLEVFIDCPEHLTPEESIDTPAVIQHDSVKDTTISPATKTQDCNTILQNPNRKEKVNVQLENLESTNLSSKKDGLLDQYKSKDQEDNNGDIGAASRKGIAEITKKHVSGAILVPFSEEIIRAKRLHGEAKLQVEEAMQLAKYGKPFDIDGIETMADDLIESIVSNRNTLSMMTAIKNKDNYLFEHSVNCSVLTGMFAKHLKFSFDFIHDLVTGALLHDIGMIEISKEIINKEGPLTEPEKKEMQRHTSIGRMMLEKNRGVPAIAVEVCKQHHERLDGQGYMSKLHHHQINQYGRISSIVDAYDALTSDRSYRKAYSPTAAMKKLLELSGGYLDSKLVYQFIQCINIYPVGSLVQLDDARVGVVYELNRAKKDKPKVKVFYSAKNDDYFDAETIDLDHPDAREKIIKTVEIKDYDIQLESII